MTDPNHPIFKQFPELDPSTIVIRDTPHPESVWNQPPIMGTLTPGYGHYMPDNGQARAPATGGSQVQPRPQRWQPDFPGLWDDVPNSGTIGMPHSRPYPLPQSYHNMPPLSMGHPEGLAGSAGRLPERQGRPHNGAGNGGRAESKYRRS
ncbi:hypothetical protein OPQ81_008677 [Rhizoctonia solani]|nr:hypothetical protein OPQ81_008677 [Rhizoctonia solani]